MKLDQVFRGLQVIWGWELTDDRPKDDSRRKSNNTAKNVYEAWTKQGWVANGELTPQGLEMVQPHIEALIRQRLHLQEYLKNYTPAEIQQRLPRTFRFHQKVLQMAKKELPVVLSLIQTQEGQVSRPLIEYVTLLLGKNI